MRATLGDMTVTEETRRELAPPPTSGHGPRSWLYALTTTNPPPAAGNDIDGITRWIVVTRAAVLPMTLFAGLVGGLLAVRASGLRHARPGPRDRRHRPRAPQQQPDERPVRHQRRDRRRVLSARAVCAASAADRTWSRQRQLYTAIACHDARRPGDRGGVARPPWLGRRGVRDGGHHPVGRLHRTSVTAEEARPRRARRARRVGPADGRRNLSRRDRASALAGNRREHPLRPALHHRADGQARRQDSVRRAGRHADTPCDPRRQVGEAGDARPPRRVLRHGRGRDRRAGAALDDSDRRTRVAAARCRCGRRSSPRRQPSRRSTIRSGRSGTPLQLSCTCDARVRCSSWACSISAVFDLGWSWQALNPSAWRSAASSVAANPTGPLP